MILDECIHKFSRNGGGTTFKNSVKTHVLNTEKKDSNQKCVRFIKEISNRNENSPDKCAYATHIKSNRMWFLYRSASGTLFTSKKPVGKYLGSISKSNNISL